jgi:ribosomal protein S18 acetylase RimI-like enzyme
MIETMKIDQLELVAPLWEDLNALHQTLDEMCGRPRRETKWEERLVQLREKAQGPHLFQIIRCYGKPSGYCFTSIDANSKGEIDSIYVLPECRGKGFGKALVQNALEWLEQSKCEDIEISVHPANTKAIAFYWDFGFATGHTMKRLTQKSLTKEHQ